MRQSAVQRNQRDKEGQDKYPIKQTVMSTLEFEQTGQSALRKVFLEMSLDICSYENLTLGLQ